MLRPNRLKERLREGRPVFGLFCSTPAPLVVEMIGYASYDFVIIDTEHVLVNPETLEQMLRAAEVSGLTALVRVPDASPGPILRALDGGARGVVVPRVHSGDEVRAAIRASRYFPEGARGLNAGRPSGFGEIPLPSYIQQANQEIMVVPMIEDREGVAHLEEILAVPGVDMVLEGSADLSQSLGVPWQTRHPAVKEALCQIEAVCRRRGVPFCAIPRVPDDLPFWWDQGVRAFILGDERGIAFRALGAHLQRYTDQVEQAPAAGVKS